MSVTTGLCSYQSVNYQCQTYPYVQDLTDLFSGKRLRFVKAGWMTTVKLNEEIDLLENDSDLSGLKKDELYTTTTDIINVDK